MATVLEIKNVGTCLYSASAVEEFTKCFNFGSDVCVTVHL